MIQNTVAFGADYEVYRTTTARRFPYGTLMILQDGRYYRYCDNAGTAIAAGRLSQSAVPGANFDELVVPNAQAVGDRIVTITNGATTITLDQFAGGYLNVEDDAGEGHLYLIESNAAEAAGSTNFEVTLAPPGVRVAWTTATTIGLTQHYLTDIIIHPGPPTAMVVGVTPTSLAASRRGWIQTHGPASALIDAYTGTNVAIGRLVFASITVDGAVGVGRLTFRTGSTAAGDETSFTNVEDAAGTELGLAVANVAVDTNVSMGVTLDPPVGVVMEVAADTEHSLIFLTLE